MEQILKTSKSKRPVICNQFCNAQIKPNLYLITLLRLPYPVGDFIIATPTPYDTSSKIGFWEIQAQQVQMFNKSYAAKINPQI